MFRVELSNVKILWQTSCQTSDFLCQKNDIFTILNSVDPNFTYNFHVVDQAVSVGPRVRGVAAERVDVNLLARVQIVQGLGKQVDGVVHECGFRLQVERERG